MANISEEFNKNFTTEEKSVNARRDFCNRSIPVLEMKKQSNLQNATLKNSNSQTRVPPSITTPNTVDSEQVFNFDLSFINLNDSSNINKDEQRFPTFTQELHSIESHENAGCSNKELLIDRSMSMLDAVLTAGDHASSRRSRQRERSKSANDDEILRFSSSPIMHPNSRHTRKSKVSKWTKVKAAFKWERGNELLSIENNHKYSPDCRQHDMGWKPTNREVARYQRVPHIALGVEKSSDSLFSSSSGHVLSDTCSTSNLNSAHSLDDISCKNVTNNEFNTEELDKTWNKTAPKNHEKMKAKSPTSWKKTLSDVVSLSQESANRRRSQPLQKTPPSPLCLSFNNHNEDARCGKQSMLAQNCRKWQSPGNSSVPSSPSGHSDFFAELESDDYVSSCDFSEPTSPSQRFSLDGAANPSFEQQQEEVRRRYEMLRRKLDAEFKSKRREWHRCRSKPNRSIAYTAYSPSEQIEEPKLSQGKQAVKSLDEGLSLDFRKKLRKWRVKKDFAPTAQFQTVLGELTNSECSYYYTPDRIGDVLVPKSPLLRQQDLTEEFQKKLEQWNEIKKSNSAPGTGESSWRCNKKNSIESVRRSSDDDRRIQKFRSMERCKAAEKDILERISKMKAIVADHPTKAIQVQTAAGIMEFQGISRKFTRKLYEWEKFRGIGPEASTFALLHPGYCPLKVDDISKSEHSAGKLVSNMNHRSLSLDSIAPVSTQSLTQCISRLSLHGTGEFDETQRVDASDCESVFKTGNEEPEAVMVEVEDHLVETVERLKTAETETPIYKYEESNCNHVFDSLKDAEGETRAIIDANLVNDLKKVLAEFNPGPNGIDELVLKCETALLRLIANRNYSQEVPNMSSLEAAVNLQNALARLQHKQQKQMSANEACCRETLEEQRQNYAAELEVLRKALFNLNLTVDDVEPCKTIQSNTTDEPNFTHNPNVHKILNLRKEDAVTRSVSLRSAQEATSSANLGTKRRLRMRKLGSRQSSKTETDSSGEENGKNLEACRRYRRKTFRSAKQRSLDEDTRKRECRNSKMGGSNGTLNDNRSHLLKAKQELFRGTKKQWIDNALGAISISNPEVIVVQPEETKHFESFEFPKYKNESKIAEGKTMLVEQKLENAAECWLANYEKPLMAFPTFATFQNSAHTTNLSTEYRKVTEDNLNISQNSISEMCLPEVKNNVNVEASRIVDAAAAEEVAVPVPDNSNIFVKTRRKIFTTIAEPTAASGILVIEQDLDDITEDDNACISNDEGKLAETLVEGDKIIEATTNCVQETNENLDNNRIEKLINDNTYQKSTQKLPKAQSWYAGLSCQSYASNNATIIAANVISERQCQSTENLQQLKFNCRNKLSLASDSIEQIFSKRIPQIAKQKQQTQVETKGIYRKNTKSMLARSNCLVLQKINKKCQHEKFNNNDVPTQTQGLILVKRQLLRDYEKVNSYQRDIESKIAERCTIVIKSYTIKPDELVCDCAEKRATMNEAEQSLKSAYDQIRGVVGKSVEVEANAVMQCKEIPAEMSCNNGPMLAASNCTSATSAKGANKFGFVSLAAQFLKKPHRINVPNAQANEFLRKSPKALFDSTGPKGLRGRFSSSKKERSCV